MPLEVGSQLGYLPQLDGIRAFAVTIVLCSHFMPASWTTAKAILPVGFTGVDIFFVLSGFLITGILLKGRAAIDQGAASWKSVARAFYFRRSLRIFPIYYLTLGYAVIAGLGISINDILWHAAYLSNVLMFKLDRYMGPTTHLWSLSVEEQFYAIWPALVLAVPRKQLRVVLWTLVVGGCAFRVAGQLWGSYFTQMQLPACVDLFAIGAFLADAHERSPAACRRTGDVALRAAVSGAALAAVLAALPLNVPAWELARRSVVGLFAAWVISRAVQGIGGVPGTILGVAPVRYIGKVSYGIYLYHGFFGEALRKTTSHWSLESPAPGALFIMFCCVSVGAAAASWRFIEKPILGLKEHRLGRIAA